MYNLEDGQIIEDHGLYMNIMFNNADWVMAKLEAEKILKAM